MALKLGAADYFECSSLSNVGVREVFEAVTRLSLFEYVSKKKRFGGGFTRRLLGR
jgi:predicted aldo/keto reductase-like oxidoreductase